MHQVRSLTAASYQPHAIHGPDRIWAETNCYVDVVLELIHAYGFDPVAALPFTLAIDFEGDQWTFFKYAHQDLRTLYGFEVQEMNPWEHLPQHVETQVKLGRPVLVELDSCYLPDTAGTTYQAEHVKSTVAVNAIDVANRQLGYFHGQSYYELGGDDFDAVFQMQGLVHERMLPPYIELVKLHAQPSEISEQATTAESLRILQRELSWAPKANPFEAFTHTFEGELPALQEKGIEHFHKYSFATFRQFGACYELAATYLQWLQQRAELNLQPATDALLAISQQSKAVQMQLARAVARKKPVDMAPLQAMGEQWQAAFQHLNKVLG